MFIDDVNAGRGGLLIDPKGSTAKLVMERLPEEAIGRTVVIDLTDEDVVGAAAAADERGGRHPGAGGGHTRRAAAAPLPRPRPAQLGHLGVEPVRARSDAGTGVLDLLRLWSDTPFRAWVTSLVQDDPVLVSFFGWFNGLNPAERSFVLAAPMNKIRPLLQRASVRNVLGAPRATFTMAQALKEKLIVIVIVPEGVLGKDATTLIGQVVLARLWAAVQARSGRAFYPVTIDEAPRFLDQPTDLGEVLARSREYGVGHDPDRAVAAAVPGELARGGAQQRPDEDRVRHVGQ